MGATMAKRRQAATKARNTKADLGIKKPMTGVPPSAQTKIRPKKKG